MDHDIRFIDMLQATEWVLQIGKLWRIGFNPFVPTKPKQRSLPTLLGGGKHSATIKEVGSGLIAHSLLKYLIVRYYFIINKGGYG